MLKDRPLDRQADRGLEPGIAEVAVAVLAHGDGKLEGLGTKEGKGRCVCPNVWGERAEREACGA